MCQGLLNINWEAERSPVPIHIPFAFHDQEEEEQEHRPPFTLSELYRTLDRIEDEAQWNNYREIANEFTDIIHDLLTWEEEFLCWREGWDNFYNEFGEILTEYFWEEENWDF